MARKINYEWVKQQFADAKVRIGVGNAVLELLKTWDGIDMSPDQSKQALDIFSKVGLGHSLVPDSGGEVWVDAQRGQINVGDVVRVRHDAFSESTGYIHNGRRGIVAAIRSGDIIFKSTDELEPNLDGTHYRPETLQKRTQ
jgi:hypothetical protein